MLGEAQEVNLINTQPLWLQFVVFLLLKDFLEWCVHNLLHRVPALWAFHKLHHSIEELDWIGNFRFHWMEVVIYKSLTYFPLVVLGVVSWAVTSHFMPATYASDAALAMQPGEDTPTDAQREACQAYIVSQKHAGWVASPDMYDDGGLSGGNMERPALQRMSLH